MSKFNFLAGGYYGKLGETVGQRWKNKRIVRAYSKPADPKTAKQEANREQFSLATKATQLAMQMNGGDKLWYSANNTEFSRRISDARNALKLSQNTIQIMPLIPYGTLADIEMSTQIDVADGVLTFSSLTEYDIAGRKISIIIQAIKIGGDKLENFILSGTFAGTAGDWKASVFIPDGYSITKDCWCAAVSPATKSEEELIIYLAPQTILPPADTVYLTITSASATTAADGKKTIKINFAQELGSGLPNVSVVANGTYQSQLKEVAFSAEEVGTFAGNSLSFTIDARNDVFGQPARFSSASKMEIAYFEVDTPEHIFILQTQEVDNITDDKAAESFSLSYTVVSDTFTAGTLRAKTAFDVAFENVTAGECSFEHYLPFDRNARTGTAVLSYETSTNSLTAALSAEQNKYNASRSLTITKAVGVKYQSLAYAFPVGSTFTQTSTDKSSYNVAIGITGLSFVRNSASSYTATFSVDVGTSNGNAIPLSFQGYGALQGNLEDVEFTQSAQISDGKITVTFTPPQDSLGQYMQFTQSSGFLGFADYSNAVGMTNYGTEEDGRGTGNTSTEVQTYVIKNVSLDGNSFSCAFPGAAGAFNYLVDENVMFYDADYDAFGDGDAVMSHTEGSSKLFITPSRGHAALVAYGDGKWWFKPRANQTFTAYGITYRFATDKVELTGLPNAVNVDGVWGFASTFNWYGDYFDADAEGYLDGIDIMDDFTVNIRSNGDLRGTFDVSWDGGEAVYTLDAVQNQVSVEDSDIDVTNDSASGRVNFYVGNPPSWITLSDLEMENGRNTNLQSVIWMEKDGEESTLYMQQANW